MKKCCNCFEQYDDELTKCSHCGYTPGDPPKELYHLFPGSLLKDRYSIGMVLGFGGFGITYKAWDNKLDTVVAIKEYYPSGIVSRSPGEMEIILYNKKRQKEFYYLRDRFLEEARNIAKFNSENNIVNVFEFFEDNNTAYIVMEFLDGISVKSYMTDYGIMGIDSGIAITEAIADALGKIHAKGIIHRDISPDNIFLCTNGDTKLIDFGAARFSLDENKLMTIIVKPGFAPPEQYQSVNEQGPWTDVYALGATLYYMITGVKPEESTNRVEHDTLRYPHELNNEIPEYISNSIMKAMAVETHMRFRDVKSFIDGLHKEIKVLSLENEKKKRRKKRFIGMVATAVVLASGASAAAIKLYEVIINKILPVPCTVSMWYCKSGDIEADEAEEKAYNDIIKELNESYPKVTIELKGYEEEEYVKLLSDTENLPDIYEYVGTFSAGETPFSFEEVYHSEKAKHCSLLSQAQGHFGGYELLPLGFSAPVVFCDKVLCPDAGNSVSDPGSLPRGTGGVKSFETDYEGFEKMFPGSQSALSETAFDDFAAGNTAFYGSLTKNYSRVTDELPAQYKIMYCDANEINCVYENVWAANSKDDYHDMVLQRIMEFMLTDNAQDILHVRNKSGSLPLNDNALDVYVSVFSDYEKIFDNKNKYVFEKRQVEE